MNGQEKTLQYASIYTVGLYFQKIHRIDLMTNLSVEFMDKSIEWANLYMCDNLT